jgi:two-component system NtrC family sensor kinase
MADANGLQQAFLNLIGNAIDAVADSKEKKIEVRITTDEEVLRIRVADTGSGIPPEKAPDIFDPFFTTKPVGKGTGLGLSICYGIIKKIGGDIKVHSLKGQGTTFEIHIPCTVEVKAPEQTAT